MYCELREKNGSTIVECFGRFDEGDTNQFLQIIENIHSQGARQIIVNLTPVYFLEPKVISLFTFANDFFQSHGGTFCLVSPLSSVKNELIRSGITQSIPTYEKLYDALHRPHSAYSPSENGMAVVGSQDIKPAGF